MPKGEWAKRWWLFKFKLRYSTSLKEYPVSEEWSKAIELMINHHVKAKLGKYTITFTMPNGFVHKVWIANKWYSYGTTYHSMFEGCSDLEVFSNRLPNFKTVVMLYQFEKKLIEQKYSDIIDNIGVTDYHE